MITRKNLNRGVITVLIAGMLVGVLGLGTLVLELGRFVAAQTQLSASAGSTATSMIAFYDTDLYERYGLMAIDAESFTETRCRDYLMFNSDLNNEYNSNNLSTLYDVDDVELTGLYNLTYPSVLKRQLLSRAKYRVVPAEQALNVETAEAFFQSLEKKCRFVANEADLIICNHNDLQPSTPDPEMLKALDALAFTFKDRNLMGTGGTSVITNPNYNIVLSSASVAKLPSTTGTVESPSTDEDEAIIESTVLNAIDKTGVDISAFGTVTEYNETDISFRAQNDMEKLARRLDTIYTYQLGEGCYTGTNATGRDIAQYLYYITESIPASLHMLESDMDSNLLLNSYIASYFSNKNRLADSYMGPHSGSSIGADNMTFYASCVEYIIGGDSSEIKNQTTAYRNMFSIRMISNLYMLMHRPEYYAGNNVSIAHHLAWAYYETCADMWLLSQYNIAVPFNKTQPILPLNEPERVSAAFETYDFADAMSKLGWYNGSTFVIPGTEAFSYTDSLALALWFVPNSTKLMRVADLIQLEMRYRQQYVDGGTATFLMSEQNTYCRVTATAKLRAMLPIISLGDDTIQGTKFRAIRYSGY